MKFGNVNYVNDQRRINVKRKRTVVLFMCTLLLLSGCTKENPSGSWGSFTADKTYSYDEKYYALQETGDEIGGVEYIKVSIYETETEALVDYFYPARAWDFWGICWENDTYNIWTQSADIGIYCYKYEDMKWQRDESMKRPEYIISKYDELAPISESGDGGSEN